MVRRPSSPLEAPSLTLPDLWPVAPRREYQALDIQRFPERYTMEAVTLKHRGQYAGLHFVMKHTMAPFPNFHGHISLVSGLLAMPPSLNALLESRNVQEKKLAIQRTWSWRTPAFPYVFCESPRHLVILPNRIIVPVHAQSRLSTDLWSLRQQFLQALRTRDTRTRKEFHLSVDVAQ